LQADFGGRLPGKTVLAAGQFNTQIEVGVGEISGI
jgi:hypothetical protein